MLEYCVVQASISIVLRIACLKKYLTRRATTQRISWTLNWHPYKIYLPELGRTQNIPFRQYLIDAPTVSRLGLQRLRLTHRYLLLSNGEETEFG
jgi:hypothetical protein